MLSMFEILDEASPAFSTTLWSSQWDNVCTVERDNCYETHMDLPGVDPGDVTIDHDDGKCLLIITGHRMLPTGEKRNIARQAIVPRGSDTSAITATHKNGVLIFRFPKKEKRHVPISIEDQSE